MSKLGFEMLANRERASEHRCRQPNSCSPIGGPGFDLSWASCWRSRDSCRQSLSRARRSTHHMPATNRHAWTAEPIHPHLATATPTASSPIKTAGAGMWNPTCSHFSKTFHLLTRLHMTLAFRRCCGGPMAEPEDRPCRDRLRRNCAYSAMRCSGQQGRVCGEWTAHAGCLRCGGRCCRLCDNRGRCPWVEGLGGDPPGGVEPSE